MPGRLNLQPAWPFWVGAPKTASADAVFQTLDSGVVNGSAAVSVTVVKTAAITPATVNGVATVSATVVKTALIVPATVNGVATVSSTAVVVRRVAPATVNGLTTVSDTIVVIRRIQPATVNGQASVVIALTDISGGGGTTVSERPLLGVGL